MPDDNDSSPNPLTELFGEVIHSYTRADALRDGWLIDVSDTAAEVGFRLPVAVTRSVWAQYCEWPDDLGGGQSTSGRLWDVLLLAAHAARTASEPTDRVTYEVGVVPRDNVAELPVTVTLYAQITGEGEQGNPVITIMTREDL